MDTIATDGLREPQSAIIAPNGDVLTALREGEIARRLRRLVAQAGGDRFLGYSLQTWHPRGPKSIEVKRTIADWIRTFPDRLRANQGIVLYGPVGTGKDHLAFAAVASAVRQCGATAVWWNGRDLMGEVRDRIDEERPERQLVADLEEPDILVISDPLPPFGGLSAFQADLLYRIAENRIVRQNRVTVVTLNVKTDAEADEKLGPATWDRLCCGAWKIACFGKSHRQPAREVSP